MRTTPEPVAIVGMACRFPGSADSLANFWDLLCSGRDAISNIPAGRWDVDRFYHSDKRAAGKMYVRQGGFLRQDLNAFDADFFNITPKEAAVMDPQQRLLLEVAFEALCDAGIPLEQLKGQPVGTFIGGFTVDRTVIQFRESNRHLINAHSAAGMTLTVLSARLAHWLDVNGPCLSLDTACSSSLVALHLAAQSLTNGECHTALVGGVNTMLIPDYSIAMCKGQFLSRDGRCKAFSAQADGYGRSEGAGLVVLKPLSKALADGDRIYATLLGTGTNHNGRTTGIAQPETRAQQALMLDVQQRAGVSASQIDYVEAHGTGTQAGDRAESEALGNVIGAARMALGKTLLVGAVKSNIGHLEAAAGIAGLIKTALVLHHQQLPANLHCAQPNPDIPFEAWGLTLARNYQTSVEVNVAAVNSFGYGGSNAHVILARHQDVAPFISAPPVGEYYFPLSAQSPAALQQMAARYADFVVHNPMRIDELCSNASLKRSHLRYRELCIASTKDELQEQLIALSVGRIASPPTPATVGNPGVVFVFSGMGSGYRGMAKALWESEPVFHDTFVRCDEIVCARYPAGQSLTELLWGESEGKASDAQMQVAIVATQIALVDLWKSWGIVPAAVIGHSTGEMAAAYTAGIMSMEHALRLAIERSRLQSEIEGQGRLLAVELDANQANALLATCDGKVEVAAVNTPTARVFAGDNSTLLALARQLSEAQVFHSFASVNTPYHSRYLEPLRESALTTFRQLAARTGAIPFYSTVTGARVDGQTLSADYWWQNMRQTVQFDAALRTVLNDGYKFLLEVGGHPVLSPYLKKTAPEFAAACFASLHRKKPALDYLRQNLQALYRAGAAIGWPQRSRQAVIAFPDYPWQRSVFANESSQSLQDRQSDGQRPLLGKRLDAPEPCWEQELDERRFAWLQDHQVGEKVVFPAAAYIEAALEAACELQKSHSAVLDNLAFEHICYLPEKGGTRLRLQYQNSDSLFAIFSAEPGEEAQWVAHARGQRLTTHALRRRHVDIQAIQRRCNHPYQGDLQVLFAALGLKYGPCFTLLHDICLGEQELIVSIRTIEALECGDYLIHPALLDASFQSLLALMGDNPNDNTAWLPTSVRNVQFCRAVCGALQAHVRLRYSCAEYVEGDITLFDADGEVYLNLTGLRCNAVKIARRTPFDGMLYHWQWQPVTLPAAAEENCVVIAPMELVPGVMNYWQEAAQLRLNGTSVLIMPPQLSNDEMTSSQLPEALHQFAQLAHALANQSQPCRVALVTTNAIMGPEPQAPVALSQAAFWGIARTLLSELPQLDMRIVDVEQPCLMPSSVVSGLMSLPRRGEYCLRGDNLYQQQLSPASATRFNQPDIIEFDCDDPRRIVLHQVPAAALDTLRFEIEERKAPAADEIEISVCSVALHSDDMQPVSGYGTLFARIGCEITGTVLRAGRRSRFNVGTRVAAIAAGHLCASHVTLSVNPDRPNGALIVPLPQKLQSKLDPVLFYSMTAIECLRHRVRLAAGDIVVIVAQSAGMIQACIDLAKADGAIVLLVTRGEGRLRYLKDYGVDAVFDGADTLWPNAVMNWAGEQGVNVILNLSGDIRAERLLPLLANFGSLIEAGSALDTPAQDRARYTRTNLSWQSVDCLAMQQARPEAFRQLAQRALTALENGEICAIPPRIFPAERVNYASRYALESNEATRAILQFRGNAVPAHQPNTFNPVSSQGSYLITGGVRGVGFKLASWLVARGARELILVGRQGVLPDVLRHEVESWQRQGVKVRVMACDLSCEESVRDLLTTIQAGCRPLKGIVHCAATLADAPADRLNVPQLQTNLGAKASGAWFLHQYSKEIRLDWFVLFSSISSVIGNPGQAGYAAANAILDALCQLRRQQGLPVVSVNWGAIGGVGMVADRPSVAAHLASAGIGLLNASLPGDVMASALNGKSHQFTVADIQWPVLAEYLGVQGSGSPFARLSRDENRGEEGTSHRERLLALPATQRNLYLAEHLAGLLKTVTGSAEGIVDINQPTSQLGLDSLMYVEFQMQIKRTFLVDFPITQLLSGLSVREMAEIMIKKMELRG